MNGILKRIWNWVEPYSRIPADPDADLYRSDRKEYLEAQGLTFPPIDPNLLPSAQAAERLVYAPFSYDERS